ncbi:MAG: 30S ribosomal protein S2 [Alphaproteobacteria bacterium]
MALPEFTMRQLLEAGVHFGHQSHRWNPKMDQYIYGVRNRIHIIDLSKSVPLLHQALLAVRNVVAGGGRVLFVGTKRQAQEPVADAASRCAQYYINHRWLGGTLTNWKTILNSIRRLRSLEETLGAEVSGYTKKELLQLTRERDKLELSLGGIKEMGGLPDMLFLIDTNKEAIAIQEANKLGIPVVAVVDTNSDPDGITYPIPGNDDAARALNLYCDLVARAVIDGISESQGSLGVDMGEAEELPEEMIEGLEEPAAQEAPVEAPGGEPGEAVAAEGAVETEASVAPGNAGEAEATPATDSGEAATEERAPSA